MRSPRQLPALPVRLALPPPVRRRTLLCGLLGGLLPLAARAAPPALELNQASQAELEQLPGIGPDLSERLLAARRQAPFADWTDLRRRVKGLGPVRAQRLSDAGLRVAGRAYPG